MANVPSKNIVAMFEAVNDREKGKGPKILQKTEGRRVILYLRTD